jgi:CHAT domain-containing protein
MLHNDAAPAGDGSFLGVADGIYNVADPRWKPASSDVRVFGFQVPGRKARPAFELPRLAGSSREITACARTWQGSRAPMLLTGSQASREALNANIRNRPAVIHLAAHVLSPKDPEDAVIDFGLSPQGQPEMLTYSDIGNLDVQGATVVVNGCSSGDGRAGFGPGIMGLTRAWLMAGAQTVVGTRWPIPDDSGDLFQSFYSSWKTGRYSLPGKRIVAQSLQQAQLTALHGNTWRSNPKYWGAFYVMGKE